MLGTNGDECDGEKDGNCEQRTNKIARAGTRVNKQKIQLPSLYGGLLRGASLWPNQKKQSKIKSNDIWTA